MNKASGRRDESQTQNEGRRGRDRKRETRSGRERKSSQKEKVGVGSFQPSSLRGSVFILYVSGTRVLFSSLFFSFLPFSLSPMKTSINFFYPFFLAFTLTSTPLSIFFSPFVTTQKKMKRRGTRVGEKSFFGISRACPFDIPSLVRLISACLFTYYFFDHAFWLQSTAKFVICLLTRLFQK